MHVAELMVTDLKVVGADTPLPEALALLAEDHLTALPVVDARNHLLGVLSTTDILQAMAEADGHIEREQLFSSETVSDLMTPRPVGITPDSSVKEAAQQMLYLEVHRLFVVDEDRLVGVISQTDVVRGVALAKL